jgi:hypothetical protein
MEERLCGEAVAMGHVAQVRQAVWRPCAQRVRTKPTVAGRELVLALCECGPERGK